MNEGTIVSAKEASFKEFLWNTNTNRKILIVLAVSITFQLIVFKFLYPFPSFIFDDSVAYLKTAYFNLDVNDYMVGYSRFLRLFSVFTKSDTALIAFIYLLIQSSAVLLLFTLFYFYRIGRVVQISLLIFAVYSPLNLHLANLISSDGLFLALSFLWFTSLIWIIHRHSNQVIIFHAVVLLVAFTVRYNGIIFPIISGVGFLLCKMPIRKKIIGFGSGLLLCGLFVCYTSYKHMQITGYWQYSPFSGWQLANNAMYAYRYVDSADRKPVPQKLRILDNMIREYFDSSRDIKKHPQESVMASTIYMWTPTLPLWKYHDKVFASDTTKDHLRKWATVAPLFRHYGIWIIGHYPWHFIKYFMFYNAQKYYAPPLEFLETYNMKRNYAADLAQTWFGYRNNKVYTRLNNVESWSLYVYPYLSALVNVVMLGGLICYLLLKGWRQNPILGYGMGIGVMTWILNAGFTIMASSAALRFQTFPLTLTLIFSAFLIEWLWVTAFRADSSNDVVFKRPERLNSEIA